MSNNNYGNINLSGMALFTKVRKYKYISLIIQYIVN